VTRSRDEETAVWIRAHTLDARAALGSLVGMRALRPTPSALLALCLSLSACSDRRPTEGAAPSTSSPPPPPSAPSAQASAAPDLQRGWVEPVTVHYRIVPRHDMGSTNKTPFSEKLSIRPDPDGKIRAKSLFEALRKVPLGERKFVGLWQRNMETPPAEGKEVGHQRIDEEDTLSTMFVVRAATGTDIYLAIATWKAGEPQPKCDLSCDMRGECTAKEGDCVAASNADCRKGRECPEHGACSARGGRCVAASDDDCKGSSVCSRLKACKAREGRCDVP
jgi:hypothetical protein